MKKQGLPNVKSAGKVLLSLLTVVLSFGFAAAQTTVTVGGTSASMSCLNIPCTIPASFSYTQCIYTTTQLTNAGLVAGDTIKSLKIAFNVEPSSFANIFNNWIFYLRNTTKNNFSSTSDWVAASAMTLVFNGPATSFTGVPASGTWYEFVFSTPFVWSGDNIILAADENTPNSSTTNGPAWLGFVSDANTGLIYYSTVVSANPNPNTPPTTSSPPSTLSGRTATIPKVQFVKYDGVPLAIRLGNIAAVNCGIANRIDWATMEECKGDCFVIERSTDTKAYETIGRLDACGLSGSKYSFMDDEPVAGMNYYRLLLLDKDGRKHYSNVVSARPGSKSLVWSVYPNPATKALTVEVEQSGTWFYMYDLNGKMMMKGSLQTGKNILDVSGLAKGYYTIKMGDEVSKILLQ